jgi:pSer/pThr/pTyr-binding forkhead associated (FHA) protein
MSDFYLVVVAGEDPDDEYPILQGDNVIGRCDGTTAADINIAHQDPGHADWISRAHACIGLRGTRLEIKDLHSANGTSAANTLLNPGQWYPLKVGDHIQIGDVILQVQSRG